jgi:hypothetical protein
MAEKTRSLLARELFMDKSKAIEASIVEANLPLPSTAMVYIHVLLDLPEKRVESYKVNDTPAWEWKEEAYLLECFETAQWSSSAVIVPSSSFKAFMNTITSEPQAAQSTNGKSRSPTTFAF